MVLREVLSKKTASAALRAVDHHSGVLSTLYESHVTSIIQSGDDDDKHLGLAVLTALSIVGGRLETNRVIAMIRHLGIIDAADMSDEMLYDWIIQVCHGLVMSDAAGLALVHPSVLEYLAESSSDQAFNGGFGESDIRTFLAETPSQQLDVDQRYLRALKEKEPVDQIPSTVTVSTMNILSTPTETAKDLEKEDDSTVDDQTSVYSGSSSVFSRLSTISSASSQSEIFQQLISVPEQLTALFTGSTQFVKAIERLVQIKGASGSQQIFAKALSIYSKDLQAIAHDAKQQIAAIMVGQETRATAKLTFDRIFPRYGHSRVSNSEARNAVYIEKYLNSLTVPDDSVSSVSQLTPSTAMVPKEPLSADSSTATPQIQAGSGQTYTNLELVKVFLTDTAPFAGLITYLHTFAKPTSVRSSAEVERVGTQAYQADGSFVHDMSIKCLSIVGLCISSTHSFYRWIWGWEHPLRPGMSRVYWTCVSVLIQSTLLRCTFNLTSYLRSATGKCTTIIVKWFLGAAPWPRSKLLWMKCMLAMTTILKITLQVQSSCGSL